MLTAVDVVLMPGTQEYKAKTIAIAEPSPVFLRQGDLI